MGMQMCPQLDNVLIGDGVRLQEVGYVEYHADGTPKVIGSHKFSEFCRLWGWTAFLVAFLCGIEIPLSDAEGG